MVGLLFSLLGSLLGWLIPLSCQPFVHDSLGGPEGSGLSFHMAFVGRSSLLDSVEPVLQILQWMVDYPVSVFQKIMVFLQKGGSAFANSR